MKEKILQLIAEKPKHFSKLIKSSPDLYLWVVYNSLIKSDNLSEMVYSAIHQVSNICQNGKAKKFVNINLGYSGCGRASTCGCVKEQLSSSLKESKKQVSNEQKNSSLEKRRKTNLQKYGHINAAQSESARSAHKEFYANPVNIERITNRFRQISIEKYRGVNPGHTDEANNKRLDTLTTKYKVNNVAQLMTTKAKLRERMAEYKANGHLLKKGYERFKKTVNDTYNFTLLTTVDEYLCIQRTGTYEYQFKCNSCGLQKTSKFYYGRGITCDVCNPKKARFTSNEEQALFDYISKDLGVINGYQGDRTIINPYELDMVFPDQKIAIEYCGLYWHSEAASGKSKDYHQQKMKLTNAAGYRLITIFSDEWNLLRDIVESKLANIFKKTAKVFYARKLTIRDVIASDAKVFLNLHHAQGYSLAKINLGLFNGEDLVALMTFSNGRKALNMKVVTGEYELVRFATDGSSVVGGASRLLKHFVRTYNPTKITSYADLRWSEGNVYKTIGFKTSSKPTVGYWYVDNYTTRAHRFNFTKSKLVAEGADPSKTEWEIMRELGYDRIWDCGHSKWVWTSEDGTK